MESNLVVHPNAVDRGTAVVLAMRLVKNWGNAPQPRKTVRNVSDTELKGYDVYIMAIAFSAMSGGAAWIGVLVHAVCANRRDRGYRTPTPPATKAGP